MSLSTHQELNRRTRELHALTEVAKTLTSPQGIPELLQSVMDKLVDVIAPAEFGVVMLWDQSAGLFRPMATFGMSLETLRNMGLRASESITGKVYDDGNAMLFPSSEAVAEAQEDLRPANRAVLEQTLGRETVIRGILATPLIVSDKRFGVLLMGSISPDVAFEPDDIPFVQTLADLIALAIDRARLVSEAASIRDAEEVERIRSEALATLSHELRTPLAAIKGYSTALLLEDVEWSVHKRTEFLRLIDGECDNLQAMINDLLDSSLFNMGQLVIEKQPVRLPLLVREIVEEMQRRTDMHRLIVDFPSDFPILDVDPNRIRQVVRNIIDNGIKYSPGGGLVVVKGDVRERDVVVSISDQGVGISPEDLIPLFEMYFRVKAPTGYYVPGTGLGLPVARAIVEAHDGRIWAESKLGEGTTLYFSLPLGPSATIGTN